jgi:aminopeptidase C
MSDDWFSEFTYQVVINKNTLEQEIRDIVEWDEATELDPWVGSLRANTQTYV